MSFGRIVDLMTELVVEELGYVRFAARGSDQGGLVQQLYLNHIERLPRTRALDHTPSALSMAACSATIVRAGRRPTRTTIANTSTIAPDQNGALNMM